MLKYAKVKAKYDKKGKNTMENMANQEIKNACQMRKITLWQVAEQLGIADTTFSKHLRRELPEKRKQEILSVIEKLDAERAGSAIDE